MPKICSILFVIGVAWTAFPAYARQKLLVDGDYDCTMQAEVKVCRDIKGRLLTGKISRLDSQGNVIALETYQNGYPNGLTTLFDSEGRKIRKTYYKNGVKNGSERFYYDNRTIKSKADYKDGLLHGQVEYYSEKGVLLGKLSYKNGYFDKGYCVNYRDGRTEKQKIARQNSAFNQLIRCGEE